MPITNNSKGVRGFNMRTSESDGQAVKFLAPGESDDFDLIDPANPVYKAWKDAGEVDFGSALDAKQPKAKPVPPLVEPAPPVTK